MQFAKKDLCEETWNCLLRIILLFSAPILSSTVSQFTLDISRCLTLTIFEVWIRSKTFNVTLWDQMKKDSSLWMHSRWLIDRWNSVCISFSRRILAIIFGGNQDLAISYTQEQDLVKHDLTDLQTMYFWYKFLTMILEHKIDVQPIYLDVSKSISRQVSLFLEECRMAYSHTKTNSGSICSIQ